MAELNGNTAMLGLALVRFGRFDEWMAIDQRPNGKINQAMYNFAIGFAAFKLGDHMVARTIAGELRQLAKTTMARIRFHNGADIVGTLGDIRR